MRTIDRQFILAAIAILGVAVLALWPLLSPGMSADDYALQTFARFTREPWTFFVEDHSSSYFYRPLTMTLWWLVAQASPDAQAQQALNIALHALNALLAGALAWRWCGRWQALLLAGVLFAVHPSIAATPLWLADRFDLSATFGVLAALLLLERAVDRGRAGWLLPLAAFWAMASKEIGVIVAALAVLRLLAAPALAWSLRLRLALAVVAPVALLLLARAMLLRGVERTLGIADLAQAALTGIGAWWQRWPVALGLDDPWTAAGIALLLGGACCGWWLRARRASDGKLLQSSAGLAVQSVRAPLWVLAGLLVLPSLVQWPVTHLVLAAADALANPANLRFYYLSFVAVAVFVGVGLARLPAALATTAALLVAAGALPPAREQARDWGRMTTENDRPVAAAVALLADQPLPEGPCVVQFSGLDAWPDHAGFLDTSIKSRLPANSPWLGCVFLTHQAPWYSVLPGPDCDDARMAPLEPRIEASGPLHARRFGSLCVVHPQTPDPADIDGVAVRWRWTGAQFER